NGNTFTEWGPDPDITSGTGQETYQVAGPVDRQTWMTLFPHSDPNTLPAVIPFWVINVTPTSARDGRYKGLLTHPDQVLWGRAGSSPNLIQIDELLVHTCPNCRPLDETKIFTRVPFVEPLNPDYSVKITMYSGI